MYSCSARERRAHMSDDEFWADVYGDWTAEDWWEECDPDVPLDVVTDTPCPICNATNACGWDVEGRPLIHAIPLDVDSI